MSEDVRDQGEGQEPSREATPLVIDWSRHWALDATTTFLNHGSFGATPTRVLRAQTELRSRMEAQPVHFFTRELQPMLDRARGELADFVGAHARDLVFVPNATTGVNAVLRSLELEAGDELLATNHGYNACNNALEFVAKRAGAKAVFAPVPFPAASDDDLVDAVLACVTPRTRLALLDHVTSATGLILPIARLIEELGQRGVDVLVDGAHAPGMVALDLEALGAAYYTGNCHKWLCAPKGAAFLHVREDKQDEIRPVTISHGANMDTSHRSRFQLEFAWTGTWDPTAYLCVPEALRFMSSLVPGGWPALMQRNHDLTIEARDLLAATLGLLPESAPESAPGELSPAAMLGSMATLPLPALSPDELIEVPGAPYPLDPLQIALFGEAGIEVPFFPWCTGTRRLMRISVQLYNTMADYETLNEALKLRI